jgi:ATP-dependent helicase IRC3
MPLRPFQEIAVSKINGALSRGISRQLLVMATGTGKTEVFSHLPEKLKHKLPGQQMVLLHRDELAKQALNKLRLRNPLLNIQQEAGANHCDPSTADAIVASVQSLGRKGTSRLDKFNVSSIDKFVVDEAHRSLADSYYNVYNHFNLIRDNDPRLLLGVTATPQRGNGQGLGSLYQEIVHTYSLRQAIEEGYLVDVKGIRVDTQTSLDGVSINKGEYDKDELAAAVDNPARNFLVYKAYIDNCAGRQAIGFGAGVKHAQNLAEMFRKYGIKAEAVWGEDPDRQLKIDLFRAQKLDVLFNAQLLVEGFDLHSISCVILSSPTNSPVVFSQRVGRGTRLPDGFNNMKEVPNETVYKRDCIILDVCDSTSRHSLITLPTLLGLPSALNLRGRSLVGSAKILEEKSKELSHIDFSTLNDIDQIKAFVESVDLFAIKPPPEIEASSKFTWHPAMGGGYILLLPEKGEQIKIEQNLLDKWELKGYIRGNKYKGERPTMEEAFAAADNLIKKVAPESLKIVDKSASWRNNPASKKQITALKKLYKGKQIPDGLTSGEASDKISEARAKKK